MAAFLLFTLACSSGKDPPDLASNAKKLVYTNPAQGSYQLIQNASLSTPNQVVLELVGPTGVKGRGIAFQAQTNFDRADWVKVASTDPELAQNGSVWDLSSGSLPMVTLMIPGQLDVGLGQKGMTISSQDLGAPLLRVSLKMRDGAPSGDIPLSVTKAYLLPENGIPIDITIATGSLKIE